MFRPPKATYSPDPFPHAVIRGAWDDDVIDRCKAEVEAFRGWTSHKTDQNTGRKSACGDRSRLPETVVKVIDYSSSAPFLDWLEALTGEKGLMADPHLEGGGIHRIKAGGFLNMHVDFNYSRRLKAYRRLNVLLYLNRGWRWNGELCLGDRKIAPEANTMVVFTTSDKSRHGHPEPLNCPESVSRDSIALYYYVAQRPMGLVENASTVYG